jgi:hypothetical protein
MKLLGEVLLRRYRLHRRRADAGEREHVGEQKKLGRHALSAPVDDVDPDGGERPPR